MGAIVFDAEVRKTISFFEESSDIYVKESFLPIISMSQLIMCDSREEAAELLQASPIDGLDPKKALQLRVDW